MDLRKKVLVTGGAGFIGSNVCESLIEDGHSVVCLDNLITGHENNIYHLLDRDGFQFIKGDIRDGETLERAIDGCTHVCHQAALGSVPRSVMDPIATHSHNATGTLMVFNAAFKAGVRRVVYASSSSVYGDEETLPKVEHLIGSPLSPYAVTKVMTEQYARVYADLHGMEMIGLRYFNVFGRRQDPEGAYAAVIPRFMKSFLEGESPQIHGDGHQTRDFTYIENVVQANRNALFEALDDGSAGVFNIAYGKRESILNLFLIIRGLLSESDPSIAEIEADFISARPGDIPHSLADISEAQRLLKYSPQFDLESGLAEAIEYYLEILK